MALGTVTTINIDNISGTVTESGSLTVYDFLDTNFPFTGLTGGSTCSFSIDFSLPTPIAFVLFSSGSCEF